MGDSNATWSEKLAAELCGQKCKDCEWIGNKDYGGCILEVFKRELNDFVIDVKKKFDEDTFVHKVLDIELRKRG